MSGVVSGCLAPAGKAGPGGGGILNVVEAASIGGDHDRMMTIMRPLPGGMWQGRGTP
jgi:hypothetical protein